MQTNGADLIVDTPTSIPMFSLVDCIMFNVRPDPMHIVDLGIAHYVFGSLFFTLCCSATTFSRPSLLTAVASGFWGGSI